ncbi:MAG: RNA polymerase sigma factor SigJ [Leptospiraceae bacterium]|nr:RNA polymerase sigma factor SigJ [Leptospiraceae bacterium]
MQSSRAAHRTIDQADRSGRHAHSAINEYRRYMFAVAYRMLGSVADAEEVVQESFVQFLKNDAGETIDNIKSYLAAMVTRRSIDLLRSRRRQREEYVGTWLPEPVLTDTHTTLDPALRYEEQESVQMAFLFMLERLSPLERAVFILRDVFDYEYAEIGTIIERHPASCRKIIQRARQALRGNRKYNVSHKQKENLLNGFVAAVRGERLDQLIRILAHDVRVYTDSGGKAVAARNTIIGNQNAARLILGLKNKAPDTVGRILHVNGQPAMVLYRGARIETIICFEMNDRGQIQNVYSMRNPDRMGNIPRKTPLWLRIQSWILRWKSRH